MTCRIKRCFALALLCFSLLARPALVWAEPIAVRYPEGLLHGFLALRTLQGKTLAYGDLIQFAKGDQVTSRVIFRFKDGSVHDETTVFSQDKHFHVLTDHLVQKGPVFKDPLDVLIDASTGSVTIRSTDSHGKESVSDEHIDLPEDLANGLIFVLLKNLEANAENPKVAMLATTPKARLVKLAISRQGLEPFKVTGFSRKAIHYVVKIEIGGAAGVLAPLIGKKPADIHVWILEGDAPVFLKSEGPLFYGGPVWRIELVGPLGH
jgi:hypothetical protein